MLYIYLPVLYSTMVIYVICHRRGLCRRAGFSAVPAVFLVSINLSLPNLALPQLALISGVCCHL